MSDPSQEDYWAASEVVYGEAEAGGAESQNTVPTNTKLLSDLNVFLGQEGISRWTPIAADYIPTDGFFAGAFLTNDNQIIIAYEGTVFNLFSTFGTATVKDDYAIFEGKIAQALVDAGNFAVSISAEAASYGVSQSDIFVTGHSLGGIEAEYASLKLDLTGVAFGATGLPGYTQKSVQPNFVTYVDYGDPVGNFASNMPFLTGEMGYAPSSGMDHVGSVVMVGNPTDALGLSAALVSWAPYAFALPFLKFHYLGNYAIDLGISAVRPLASVSASVTTFSPEAVLSQLDATLGVSGQQDLDAAVLLGTDEIRSPNFDIQTSALDNTITITQNQQLTNDYGPVAGDLGTDVLTLDPTTLNVVKEAFTDSTTGQVIQLLANPSPEDDGQDVTIAKSGDSLIVENVIDYTGTIYHFVPGEIVDLADIGTATTVELGPNNVLALENAGTTVASIKLDPSENFFGDTFLALPDASGGTYVTIPTETYQLTTRGVSPFGGGEPTMAPINSTYLLDLEQGLIYQISDSANTSNQGLLIDEATGSAITNGATESINFGSGSVSGSEQLTYFNVLDPPDSSEVQALLSNVVIGGLQMGTEQTDIMAYSPVISSLIAGSDGSLSTTATFDDSAILGQITVVEKPDGSVVIGAGSAPVLYGPGQLAGEVINDYANDYSTGLDEVNSYSLSIPGQAQALSDVTAIGNESSYEGLAYFQNDANSYPIVFAGYDASLSGVSDVPIENFQAGDTIDVGGLGSYITYLEQNGYGTVSPYVDVSNGMLEVGWSYNGAMERWAEFELASYNGYTPSSFSITPDGASDAPDGNGGFDITTSSVPDATLVSANGTVTFNAQASETADADGLFYASNLTPSGTVSALIVEGPGIAEISGDESVDNLEIASGGTLSLQDGSIKTDPFTVDDGGSITGFGALAGDGSVEGAIIASGGVLALEDAIVGSGTLIITSGATLRLDGAVGSGITVAFESGGTGTLELADPGDMRGTITGEVSGDAVTDVACFRAGTRIRTAYGEVAVEALTAGDSVHSELGGPMPVRWIGHRCVDCRRHPTPEAVWPVRIAAGAFGPDLPHRDLWLSPDHAVYAQDVLIPIKHLINGTSIAQVPVDEVTYYHVELPEHDVLLAEGLPAESYLDIDDKSNFSNGGQGMRLFPDFSSHPVDISMLWEAKSCAPLVVYGPEYDSARRQVSLQAAALTPQRAAA
jgi:hypothetical protein